MKKTIAFLLIATLLFVVACKTETTPEPVPGTPSGVPGTAVVEEPDSDTAEDSETGGAMNDLIGLFTKKASLEYTVSYDVSSTMNGDSTDSEMTQYVDGKKMRIDSETEGMKSRIYMMDDTTTTCSDQDGWQCFQMAHQETAADTLQKDVEENVQEYDVRALPPRTIAGKATLCFEITVEGSTVEYCFSKEGAPLFVKTEGSRDGSTFSSEMIATDFSGTVSSNAFELPAEPTDLGNIPGMGDMDDLIAQYS